MAFSLTGKTFLITGASSGIGRGCAIYFSQLGARVILAGRSQDKLDETLVLMDSNLEGHLTFSCDLTDMAALTDMMDSIYHQVGALDGFVHSAGIQKTIALRAIKESYIDELYQLNIKASHYLLKAISKPKRFNPYCSCLFIGSAAGEVGESCNMPYSAMKAGMHHLTRSAALELKQRKIRVNCLAPGMTHTPLTFIASESIEDSPYKCEWAQPEDIAYSAAFLCSDLARLINGVVLPIDDGYCAG
ncbi:SDR family NAD(P)-dependent oxidoreductase [Shewanella halifaxensis]|uniref:SDR family NAD(P)-dependent oxidoreductase n=1 Tax=Shewanella halifaxensis TaxID=271098 RepID=UPI000D58D8C6|nr:SDR family oxidoreductase [Shewanella halifaxensis]